MMLLDFAGSSRKRCIALVTTRVGTMRCYRETVTPSDSKTRRPHAS